LLRVWFDMIRGGNPPYNLSQTAASPSIKPLKKHVGRAVSPACFGSGRQAAARRVSVLRPSFAMPQASSGFSATSHVPQSNSTSGFA